ncbi:MAG: ArsR family transcriptional regulator, partial [bacterium]|nr:ArsR family transcriptional regulator [bacterium]
TEESAGERTVFLRKEPIPGQVHRLAPITKNDIKILVISDTCLGLRTQQGDLLAKAYEIGEKEGVYLAIVAGNISAGKPRKKRLGEYFLRTFEEQRDYIISHWPKAPFKTHFITGPNDLTFKTDQGQNIGYAIAEARQELYYRGDQEATFLVGKDTRIAVVHLESDATVYTKSYPLQGITESYQELMIRAIDNTCPPKVVLVGGTHSEVLIPPRFPFFSKKKSDICSINIPSLYGITPSQRGKRRRGGAPVLGCWILTFKLDKEGNLIDMVFDARDLTAYQKKDDYLQEVVAKPNLSEEQKKIIELLREDPRTKGEICRILHKSKPEVDKLIDGLRKEGYFIVLNEAEKRFKLERSFKEKFMPGNSDKMYVKRQKTLDFSDSHIGHKKSRREIITEVYRIAEQEKVDEVHFCGDIVEGPGIKHKQGIKGELECGGADSQRELALSVWPKSKIHTKIISGSSHDFEYQELSGHNFAKTFSEIATLKKMGNIEYIGEETIWCRGLAEINGIANLLYHPSGGIPFGLTYRGQLNVERLIPIVDEDFPAQVLKVGHLHIAVFMKHKGMVCLFVPCLQDQTQYLAAKGYFPWVGFWATEVFADDRDNITRVVLKYFPFESKKREAA